MSEYSDLLNRINRLESILRQPTRPHMTQDKRHEIIGVEPARVKSGDLLEGELKLSYDSKNDKYYLVGKINGRIKSKELT